MKVVEVSGWLTVTIKKAWSTLAAMMWLCLDRLEAFRMM